MNGREAAERLSPKTSRTLSIIAAAMGMGVVLICLVVAAMHVQSTRTPSPEDVRLVNALVGAAMVAALVAIVASETVWKAQLKALTPENVDGGVQTAFIIRTALREASAMFGAVAALIAALNGTLHVYPAYWAALVPAALFLGYLAMHWPSEDNLRAELTAALPQ